MAFNELNKLSEDVVKEKFDGFTVATRTSLEESVPRLLERLQNAIIRRTTPRMSKLRPLLVCFYIFMPNKCSNDSSLNRKKKKSNEGRSAKKYSKARKWSDYETQRLIDLFYKTSFNIVGLVWPPRKTSSNIVSSNILQQKLCILVSDWLPNRDQ